MAKRQCKAITRAGHPCTTGPLHKGTMIGDYSATGTYCYAHDPDIPDGHKIGGATPGGGRKKNPRAIDIVRQKLEENADRLLNPLFEALEADIAVVVGRGEEAAVDYQPDHRTRLLAVKEILDRAYGKPKQSTEVSGPQGGPVSVVNTGDPETREAIAALLKLRPAAPRDGG